LCLVFVGEVVVGLGREFIDQISPLDMQLLINQHSKRGISEATLKYYHRGMSKVFKWT